MRHITYDKQAVLSDLDKGELSTRDIADKHGITLGNVYTIRTVARRRGELAGSAGMTKRLKDELSVLTPAIRERIKDLRERDFISSEITLILQDEGLKINLEEVNKVMARTAYDPHAQEKARQKAFREGRG